MLIKGSGIGNGIHIMRARVSARVGACRITVGRRLVVIWVL
jgi:hypothetical protein